MRGGDKIDLTERQIHAKIANKESDANNADSSRPLSLLVILCL
jgi:hypothetical protein